MTKKSRNTVRLIGGTLRRRQLTFPDADGLRPTADRVRETLFNWLGQDLTGKSCLDLFAGSGALGIEAASRHAKHVVMVEANRSVYSALKQNIQTLNIEDKITLLHMNAQHYLSQNKTYFDIIFLDPPFNSSLLNLLLPQLFEHLSSEGIIYIECPQWPALPFGSWIKQGKAGEALFGLVQCNVTTDLC